MRYLLLLPLFLLTACMNDITPPSDSPAMKPAPKAPLGALVSCAGLPNVGGIVKVNSYPATKDAVYGSTFIVTGDIVRDDASVPGVQNYCNDKNASMRWFTFTQGSPYSLTVVTVWPGGNKFAYELQYTAQTGPSRLAIAVPYNAAGTTVLSTKRDTTVVFP